MNILFLSFYYSPDLSAGSFRATQLINAMLEHLPDDVHIDVVTTQPNRYSNFQIDALEVEESPELNIYRVKVLEHNSGILAQIMAYTIYIRHVLTLTRNKNYHLVCGTSGRLMTGVLSAFLARKQNVPLYLDIRDIFVDTMSDILPKPIAAPFKMFFSIVERMTVNRANKVNLVSEGFQDYFQKRYPQKKFTYFTNCVSQDFIDYNNKNDFYLEKTCNLPLTVVYAGNIGKGQGLHKIIPQLAKRLEGHIKFRVIGNGVGKAILERRLSRLDCQNVELLSPVKRSDLLAEYQKADILFIHLDDIEALRKVLPSKLFEYAAVGKPIWAGVSGYAAKFISSSIDNATIFQPCDVDEAICKLDDLNLINLKRSKFVETFSETRIFRKMSKDVLTLLDSNG